MSSDSLGAQKSFTMIIIQLYSRLHGTIGADYWRNRIGIEEEMGSFK